MSGLNEMVNIVNHTYNPPEHKKYTVEDWKYEVCNGDTRLGYREWVEHRMELEEDDG